MTIFCCPHCAGSFSMTSSGVTCETGHSFDRAKEGYLHLLPSGRISSTSTPGDTAESLQARRRFLHAGWYAPIADVLRQKMAGVDGPVLDVGCGEGWYLSTIDAPQRYGLDISKRAIQMASRFLPNDEFVVASAYRLPVQPDSCDIVYTVFAPHSLEEHTRVLRLGGRWITVTPASRHLEEMRARKNESIHIREQRRLNPPPHAENAERITFSLALTAESAADLFTMTPLQWQTAADASPTTSVTADVWVSWGTKT